MRSGQAAQCPPSVVNLHSHPPARKRDGLTRDSWDSYICLAKTTAHNMPPMQPSHRRFERTATAKHANSPLNQVKAFNYKVLQSVQGSDSFSLHEKTLRPVRHSLEAEPLNNVKSTRKFSLDGFLDICKSRSGVVSSGAYTGAFVCM